jgi:hypothetical protein
MKVVAGPQVAIDIGSEELVVGRYRGGASGISAGIVELAQGLQLVGNKVRYQLYLPQFL